MPIGNFIAITILMVGASIFLEIHIAATEEFFEFIENFFVFLDKLEKKSWLNFCSSLDLLFGIRIFHIDCEASLSINKTDDIIWCYLFHMQ